MSCSRRLVSSVVALFAILGSHLVLAQSDSAATLQAPIVSLSATSLNFGNEALHKISAPQYVTLSNTGSGALTINSISSTSNNYSQSSNCPISPNTLPASASCVITIRFTPSAVGTRTGSITINDNAAGSPQAISLTGNGVVSIVTLSSTDVVFAAAQLLGTSSTSKTVKLTNTSSTVAVNISAIAVSGDFALVSTTGQCPASGSVPAKSSCNLAFHFAPTAVGTRYGAITITDSDAASPNIVGLIGTGTAVKLSAATLNMGSVAVGQSSKVKNVTVSNAGSTSLSITGITIGGTNPGDYSQTNTCGSSLAAGGNCLIHVTFKPTATGTRTATISIADSDPTSPQTIALTGTGTGTGTPLTLTTTSLAAGVVGTSYNQTLQATGGTTPYSWAITTGSLPAGLTLNAATGAITGTPTGPQVGTISFTATVTDSESPVKTASANLSISISAPPLSVTTLSLPGGTLGTAYSQTLAATGGIIPYTWSITTGALPAGLALNASTGVISGTPTGSATGTINFTVTATDSEIPVQTANANLSISISAPPLSVTTLSLPGGAVGIAYSQTLAATGGVTPYTWSITAGSLPAGLTLNSKGQITGTATATGTSSFTVKVTDSETPTAQSATANLSISISDPLQVITSGLTAGVINTPYPGDTLSASGGIPPYSWSISAGSLPPGLVLTPSTGLISGTPTQTGMFNFTAKVTDSSAQTATANLSININAALTITTTSLPSGNVGASYNQTVQASGGVAAYNWSITKGSLPAGLNLNSVTGQIYGTPTTTGTANFTVTVTDSEVPSGQASANLSITINNSTPLQIQTTGLPMGSEVTAYAATMYATGGVQPYTWSISSGSLPGGLTLNATSGAITGTPTALGPFSFTVEVTDSTSTHATANLSITVMTCANNAAFNGSYAALLEGWRNQQGSPSVQTASVRSFVADGSGNITGGKFDSNDQLNGPQIGKFTGTYCMGPNNLGLMTLTEVVNANSNTRTFAIALNTSNSSGRISYYDNSHIVASGPLRKQTTSAFSIGKFNGNYAFGFIGADAGGHRSGMAGEFNSDGKGHFNGIADADDNGTVSSQVTLTASNFTILSTTTGRGNVTITFNIGGGQTNTFIFYAVNATEMLIMEDDPVGNGLQAGDILQQTGGGSFTDAGLNGNAILGVQSVDNSGVSPVGDVTGGLFTANGSGAASISFDDNHGGTLSTETGAGTYSVASNGRVTLTGIGGNHQPVFYLVSQNQGFVIGTDNAVAFGQFYPQSGSSFNNASINGTYTGGSDYPEDANAGTEADSLTGDGAGNFTGSSQTDNQRGPQENPITTTYSVSGNGRAVVSKGGGEIGIMYIINPTSVLFIPAPGYNGNDPTLDWFEQ